MPSSSDYNELLSVIQGIDSEDVLKPNMPINVFVAEAEDLYHWSLADQAALVNAGLDPEMITSVPVRSGACREAQSLWNMERNMRQEAEHEWAIVAPIAFDMRDNLIHSFRYAFRKDPGLLGRVDEIAQGDTNADMVQDLNDLSILGKSNISLVTKVGITAQALDDAAEMADEVGNLLGATNGERDTVSETMIVRNKAYTYLKQAVDEIRECGKYVFWRNPDRLKGYNSEYWKQQKPKTETTVPQE